MVAGVNDENEYNLQIWSMVASLCDPKLADFRPRQLILSSATDVAATHLLATSFIKIYRGYYNHTAADQDL
jgi:hypothetical protein